MSANVREIKEDEVLALTKLAQETYTAAFGHAFLPSDLSFHLERNLSEFYFRQAMGEDDFLVADVDSQLVGFAQFGTVTLPVQATDQDQQLRRLYVLSSHQRRGIGSALIEAVLAHTQIRAVKNIYLDVWEHNHDAQSFYKRYGFETIGAKEFIFPSGKQGDNDLMMVRRTM